MTRGGRWVPSLALALLAACGTSTIPAPPEEEPALASIRLYDPRGADLTRHMPLPATQPLRVEVRMFAFNGDPIRSLNGGEELAFTFTPMSLASSSPVAGETLVREVSATSPADSHGSLTVTVRRLSDGLEMMFGPFDVLVH